MKKVVVIWFLTVLFSVGLNGCCAQLWPKKVKFTPELDLAIKDKIAEHGLESPFVLLIGDDGRTIAMGVDGKTFTPCRAPELEEIQGDDFSQAEKGKRQSRENKKEREVLSELPICEGMKDIKGLFPVESITIMKAKKNPLYRWVRNGRGMLEEQCIRVPGDPVNACD
ncbi:MAG: hypothetical protein PVG41_01775 [Desulfobacteraceae bacterium]